MGLFICLQKEKGDQIEGVADDRNILHQLLPQDGGGILSGIDWYGDTTFNGQQMTQFIPAWQEILARASTEEDKALLLSIEALAQRCASGTHLYLKFIGD